MTATVEMGPEQCALLIVDTAPEMLRWAGVPADATIADGRWAKWRDEAGQQGADLVTLFRERFTAAHADYLQSNVPGLTEDEAVTIARQGISEHLEGIGERAVRGNLRHGCDAVSERPLYVTIEAARRVVRLRTIEANRALIQEVYARANEEMKAAGLGFDLLLAYHRGDGRSD